MNHTSVLSWGSAPLCRIQAARLLWSGDGQLIESQVEAYDLHLDRRSRGEIEAHRQQKLEQWGQRGEALSLTALRALLGDPDAQIDPLDPRNLDPGDIVRFLQAGQDLEAKGMGQVTDIRGNFLLTPAQAGRLLNVVVDVALRFIEPDRQEAFLRHAAAATTGSELA